MAPTAKHEADAVAGYPPNLVGKQVDGRVKDGAEYIVCVRADDGTWRIVTVYEGSKPQEA